MKYGIPSTKKLSFRNASEGWDWLIARLLKYAFASFIHTGNLRVTTAKGDVFVVGDGNGRSLAIRVDST